MVYNLWKTAKAGSFTMNEEAEAVNVRSVKADHRGEHWHRWIEVRPIKFTVLSLIAILIGGAFEMIPTFLVKSNVPTITSVKPYTPLELEGRDIYIREGCYNCHSQMIRPFRDEVERYGEYSKAGEFVYDHPFQWGSRRIGPDLHRSGKGNMKMNKSEKWHYDHMYAPADIAEGSVMPAYTWLYDSDYNKEDMPAKISAMRKIGVPYPDGFEEIAVDSMEAQANTIVNLLIEQGVENAADSKDKEIIALIAYLERLGSDIHNEPKKKEKEAKK